MANKINILGVETNYSIQEGKVYNNKFFIRVTIQSYYFEDIPMFYTGKKDSYIQENILIDSQSIWIEVTEKKFSELIMQDALVLGGDE